MSPDESKDESKSVRDSQSPNVHAIALSELESAQTTREKSDSSEPVANALGNLRNALSHVKTKLTVCVGAADVTVGDLLNAKEHQVLVLDRSVEQPVDVLLEGQVIARGILVAVDEHFAVRITELPVSLDSQLKVSRDV